VCGHAPDDALGGGGGLVGLHDLFEELYIGGVGELGHQHLHDLLGGLP
jgi:hypothetical protein